MASTYLRVGDAILTRFMDGLTGIPSILLAIALIAIARACVRSVLIAIRVVRLVRRIVLMLREQPYIEATRTPGPGVPLILVHHLRPHTLAPVTVRATYICAAAVLTERAQSSTASVASRPAIPSFRYEKNRSRRQPVHRRGFEIPPTGTPAAAS